MVKVIELFHIGRDTLPIGMPFLFVSGSRKKYDYGFVEKALREGAEVTIRPATALEMEWAVEKFAEEGE